MKSFLLFIKKIFYKLGIDISFVRKEETRSAIELNDVETANKAWADRKTSSRFLSREVMLRFDETLSILKSHEVDLSGRSVIDVGCGNGMLLKMLDENFGLSSQTGMEYASEAIEVARQVNPAASYFVHDITSPCPERFDAVVSTEVLEHILRPIEAIKNMLAMVRDGGVLLITVPNGRNDTFSGHINFWSPESWKVFIEENSGGSEFVTGASGRHLLYALIRKDA